MAPAETATQARTCILVLGMHRSGTSAFARGEPARGGFAADINTGTVRDFVNHWEPRLVECHDAMLWETGAAVRLGVPAGRPGRRIARSIHDQIPALWPSIPQRTAVRLKDRGFPASFPLSRHPEGGDCAALSPGRCETPYP